MLQYLVCKTFTRMLWILKYINIVAQQLIKNIIYCKKIKLIYKFILEHTCVSILRDYKVKI